MYYFENDDHEEFFFQKLDQLNGYGSAKLEALVYALSITKECRSNFDDCFDAKTRSIKRDVLIRDWVDSDSEKAIRLGFNLYTSRIPTLTGDESTLDVCFAAIKYSPAVIFDSCYATCFVQALYIRFLYNFF